MFLVFALLVLSRAAPKTRHFSPDSPQIRIVGRTARANGTVYFDWSSVHVTFVATGPASILLEESQASGNRYLVEQTSDEGVFEHEMLTEPNCTEYSVLNAGESATVRVEKITEARPDTGGIVGFRGVIAAALNALPPAASRRIECIGDSMMCGAHSERGGSFPAKCNDEHGGSRESSRTSWCPVLARKLDAEYAMECCRWVIRMHSHIPQVYE
jgi:hypothetical protein